MPSPTVAQEAKLSEFKHLVVHNTIDQFFPLERVAHTAQYYGNNSDPLLEKIYQKVDIYRSEYWEEWFSQ